MRSSIGSCRQVLVGLVGLLLATSAASVNGAWVNAMGDLAGLPTECGDLQSIWAVPNTNKVITGVAANGLYATTNGGTNWTLISGNVLTVRLLQMIFDPANPNTWYAGGIYHTPGIGKTTNGGATWTGFNNVNTNDGFAVDMSDPQRKLMLAGAHESSGNLYRSTDGGATWTNIGCPGGGYSSFPVILNTQTWLMGISNGGGIYKTVNGGGAWTEVGTVSPVTHITQTSTGEFYYVGGGKVIKGSSDGSTWTQLSTTWGAAGAAPIELPGGKIAAVTGAGIAISSDKGATWKICCGPLPAKISGFWNFSGGIGLAYNTVAGSFWTFYWNCSFTNPVVLGNDQIWRYDTLIGSTDVVKPARSLATSVNAMRGSGALFDIAGRSIQHSAFVNELGAVREGLYLVRNSNGTTTKQLSTRR